VDFWYAWGMPRIAPAISLDQETRAILNGWAQAPSTAQALVLRSRIVLAAAAGSPNQQIASDLGIPQITVGKWRRSFAELGLDGLRDAPRSGRPPKHDAAVWQRVQTTACQQPESQGRWSVRTLARKVGLPHSTVHAMLKASELQPHRIRTFTFSPDPEFEPKLLDIVGLYLKPPENALVLCVDEKPGIQALDRTQPLLPLRAKKPQSWTNEYVRHGTQTMIAALEIATGKVVAHVRNRRTSVNFLRFMNEVLRAYPGRELHVVMDNLNIHKNEAGAAMARPASTGSVPLHPHARLLGKPNRVLLQHSQQTRLGPQRPALQTGSKGTPQPLHRQLQRNMQSVYLDQRARASATNHRDD
jgi:transposase